MNVIISMSTRINYRAWIEWRHLPTLEGELTEEVVARVARTAFARFYGIGADTKHDEVSSYTQRVALFEDRRGLNLPHSINVGLAIGVEHAAVENQGVPGLPLAPMEFPDAPGMGGATTISQGLDVRYDDRTGRDFAESGLRFDAAGAAVEGLHDSPNFFRFRAEGRAIWPELSWLSGASHLLWTAVTADDAPFYLQSELGGAFLLRGFNFGRFIDRQAWTVEVEQRIRIFQTHMFGVTTDWRIDPFVTAGQVFSDWNGAFDQPQVAAGVGLRAFVHPNIVGRIDLADGGEGLKVYVEIGYPY